MEIKKLYTIECRTGCSCCSGENYHEGFFTDLSEVIRKINDYRSGIGSPLGSQYARYGVYTLREHDAEVLPDGRVIIGDHVFPNSDYQSNLCGEYDI